MFGEHHVLAEKLQQIEVRLPDRRSPAVLQFGLPVFNDTGEQRREHQDQGRLRQRWDEQRCHNVRIRRSSSVTKM